MNDIETNNTAGTENSVVTNTMKRRGRPINPNKTRKVYLVRSGEEGNFSYVQRTKGAPKPNTTAYFVNVQRNVKSKDFVFNPETMQVQTETVKARTYKPKVKTEVATETTSNTVLDANTSNSVSVHESATAKVTQTGEEVVVESAVAA